MPRIPIRTACPAAFLSGTCFPGACAFSRCIRPAAALAAAGLLFTASALGGSSPLPRRQFPPPGTLAGARLAAGYAPGEVASVTRAREARSRFGVSGSGLSLAVLDTGLRVSHVDFSGRVLAAVNFTGENGGDPRDVSDPNGHGTQVAGIAAAGGVNSGVAPGAGVVPLKVFDHSGSGSFEDVYEALVWIRDHRAEHRIGVANISLCDGGNYSERQADQLQEVIRELRAAGIPVVAAAGNLYARFQRPGMAYPAVFPETISVGATFDADLGAQHYPALAGAAARTTAPDRVAPFSQRLHATQNPAACTDIFAPGANLTASGSETDTACATEAGTSQAAPVVSGVLLLMQELHLRRTGRLPSVDQLERWLRAGAATVRDGDDEDDNVPHPSPALAYPRLDAVGALEALSAELG